MQPYKAIICDLDGTLLNEHHKIGKKTIQTLQACASLGVDVFIATGRNYADVSKMAKKIGIDNLTLVTSNGARADNAVGQKILHHYIPEDIATQIFLTPYDADTVYLNSYQGDDWFINAPIPGWQQFFIESGYGYNLADFSKQHGKETEKIFFITEDVQNSYERLAPVEKYLTQKFKGLVQMTYSAPMCFEVMAKGVNKGKTLAELVAMRGYALTDCIAFGDAMNDLEMLSAVGKGCLMQNADERIRKALPNLEMIGHHNDEAVANYLQKVFASYF